MGTEQWISAAGSVIFLALAALVTLRGARNAMAVPLTYLCIAFFAYDTLEVVRHFTDDPVWDWLDAGSAALVAPPTLWLVSAFVGMRRALRVPLLVAAVYFFTLAALCAAPV